ncbi:hypothetical protein [Proteus mirabilis]|uniref:hypothetical protein n=1 Tax=Proteus mirabilis TaxID=584 RepID=UPI0022819235|nr:hypothetical protein [Proteus mirabilis]MCY9778566.1 hypothetical protein [Proteus mirabilis]MCY9781626.1 hypothetical protein [Proteus mirabilis]MCY9790752.1 hypothetical protein [Proteus mirabilis]
MSNKKEHYFISKIIVGLFLFIIFVYNIWHAESETSIKLSNLFSFISSFSIITTIIIYIKQKKDIKENNSEIKKEKVIAYSKIYKTERIKIRLKFRKFILIRDRLKKHRDITLKIRRRKNTFTFILKYKKPKKMTKRYTIIFLQNDMYLLNEISLKSIEVDTSIHEKSNRIINSYNRLHTKIDNLFIMYNLEDNNLFEIEDIPRFVRRNNFNVDDIYNETFNSPTLH